MPILNTTLQGRAGNQMCQFLFTAAVAGLTQADLRCDDWIGNRAFNMDTKPYSGPQLPRLNETALVQWMHLPHDKRPDVEFRGYAQMQSCMIYSKRQAQEWLRIRPELVPVLNRILAHSQPIIPDSIVAHQRDGDFKGYGYPVVSKQSYQEAAVKYFGSCAHVVFVTEEQPLHHPGLPDELSFLPDFYRLMQAPTLMRGNSTFSWVAALLGNGLVLSPRIDGLVGGVEHDDVRFEPGNHCKLADFDFCSDLHTAS